MASPLSRTGTLPVLKERRATAGPDGLTSAEHLVVQAARAALVRRIEQLLPEGSNPRVLKLTAFTGGFADVLTGLAVTSHAADVVAIVNKQLVASGFELVATRRQ